MFWRCTWTSPNDFMKLNERVWSFNHCMIDILLEHTFECLFVCPFELKFLSQISHLNSTVFSWMFWTCSWTYFDDFIKFLCLQLTKFKVLIGVWLLLYWSTLSTSFHVCFWAKILIANLDFIFDNLFVNVLKMHLNIW